MNFPAGHDHVFGQDRPRPGERRTVIVIAVTAVMMVVEIVAGVAYGSMALLADGLHMASHTAALGLAAFAYVYARRRAGDPRFSFGTGKVNALAGFTGAVVLAGFALVMAVESVQRFLAPVPIVFNHAIAVAVLGFVVNGASMLVLGGHGHGHAHADDPDHEGPHDHGGHDHEDHNLRSAYLHVLADALTSLLAIAALLAGKYLGADWLDPVVGLLGAWLVLRWSWGLLKGSGRVLLDRQAPDEVTAAVRRALEEPGDCRVVDLHVWSIGPGYRAAAIAVRAPAPVPAARFKARLPRDLGLAHVTLEVDTDGPAGS